MSYLKGVFQVAGKLFPARVAHAHCDIPCGIYDPHLAQVAAITTVRMNQLIQDLAKPDPHASEEDRETYSAKLGRYIAVKEQHAELCKHELRILWADYFRPEHVEKYPNLHELIWNTLKLGSRTRQNIDMDAAQGLVNSVNEIAEIFWKTKGAEPQKHPSLQPTGGELVAPH